MKRELRLKDGTAIATDVELADNPWKRFMGLMGRGPLPPSYALVLQPCSQIHMFFMRIPLDIAFVDKEGKVLHMCQSIRPWRASRLVLHATAAIEFEAGVLARHKVEPGDTISLFEDSTPV